MLSAETGQLHTEGSIAVWLDRLVALSGAVLADDPVGQPMEHVQHVLQMLHGAAAICRAQSFPRQLPAAHPSPSSVSANWHLSLAFSRLRDEIDLDTSRASWWLLNDLDQIIPCQQIRELPGVGHRVIAVAVVYARLSAVLPCVFAGRTRPFGNIYPDIDQSHRSGR